jgi:hypothetical protein
MEKEDSCPAFSKSLLSLGQVSKGMQQYHTPHTRRNASRALHQQAAESEEPQLTRRPYERHGVLATDAP